MERLCRIVPKVLQVLGYTHVLVCFSFLCFITLISAAGAIANYGTTAWNSDISAFSIVLLAVAPVAIQRCLCTISPRWLQHCIETVRDTSSFGDQQFQHFHLSTPYSPHDRCSAKWIANTNHITVQHIWGWRLLTGKARLTNFSC